MENNFLDNSKQLGYNDSQLDDDNAFVVKMDEQRPAHDNECKHVYTNSPIQKILSETLYIMVARTTSVA
jgi:hypothetical protein